MKLLKDQKIFIYHRRVKKNKKKVKTVSSLTNPVLCFMSLH